MKLYKHNNLSFTLVTHDKRIFSLFQQGEGFISQPLGVAGKEYNPNGTLLRFIPDFLKNQCFKLNTKPNEKNQTTPYSKGYHRLKPA